MKKPARILIAEHSSVMKTVTEALAGYDLVQATALDAAERLVVDPDIDLFVIGIHLDDSQALLLIKVIRESTHENTPLILLRLLPSEIEGTLRSTIEVMKSIYRIGVYLEAENDPQAAVKIRAAVEHALPLDMRSSNAQRSK